MRLIFTFFVLIIFYKANSFEYNNYDKNDVKPGIYNLDKTFFKSRNRDFANFSLYYTSIKNVGFEFLIGKDFLLGYGLSLAILCDFRPFSHQPELNLNRMTSLRFYKIV